MAWLTGWQYRKQITISGSTGAGTNYQVLLKVGESSGATGADFNIEGKSSIFPSDKNVSGDLRFTASDGSTLLDFWVEQVTGSSPNRIAYIWVEVAADLETDQNIYCYFGNPAATNVSNGDNTFLLFDDFEGTGLNTNKWSSAVSGSASVSVGNGSLTCQTGTTKNSYAGIISINSLTSPIIIDTKVTTLYTGDWSVIVFFGNTIQTNSGSQGYWWGFNHPAGGGYLRKGGMNGDGIDSVSFSISTPLKWQLIVYSSGEQGLYNGNIKVSGTDITYTSSSLKIGLQTQTGLSANSGAVYDWVLVRKYASPGPAFSSAGSLESSPPSSSFFMLLDGNIS